MYKISALAYGSQLHILRLNWSGHHYTSLHSNWQNFATYLVYLLHEWIAILDTLFQKIMLISVIFDINQVAHQIFLIKYAFYRIFVNLDVQRVSNKHE